MFERCLKCNQLREDYDDLRCRLLRGCVTSDAVARAVCPIYRERTPPPRVWLEQPLNPQQ